MTAKYEVKCGLNFLIIDGHAKFGNYDEAHLILDAMPHKETATWDALISTYEQNGRTKKALSLFHEMLHSKNAKPEEVTFVCTFCDSALLRAIDFDLKKAKNTVYSIERKDVYVWSDMVAVYTVLMSLVNTKLDGFMNLSDYIHKIIIYLDSIMSTAQHISPSDAVYKVGSGAFDHISNPIVVAFSSDSVKRFNAKAVKNVHDRDL
ncbi:unnamed protein product [Lupinus luteus]|uniref:Exocyst complex subunit EXOC6/Sec15 C-terminal domain-containing protein n=1 Tax=Lupinus luteus TaxID=3873 RepID=A0AAV1W120_LUPLU